VAQLQARGVGSNWHDRLDLLGVVPVDKAISWPLSQERERAACGSTRYRALKAESRTTMAPIQSKAVARAPVLPVAI
jgi:hypothetical protein